MIAPKSSTGPGRRRQGPSRVCILLACLLACGAASPADVIDRIEPPSWWVGMQDTRLQLMIHGDAVGNLSPAIDYDGVEIVGVTPGDNTNYLFVDLDIAPDTQPGEMVIALRQAGRPVTAAAYALQPRAAGSQGRSGFGPADVIYLVTPDRFANGDPGNDAVPGYADPPARDEPYGRHGGDIAGIIDRLDYISGLGFTQIWLNPVLENAMSKWSYHGYAITDFYAVDPRFGDNDTYRRLGAEARRRGVGLIMDVVLNHAGSQHWWMADPPSDDWINYGGNFTGTNHHRESLLDPHAAPGDVTRFTDGWFVPTMPDLNQRNPHLATYLTQNAIWWIEYAGLSGIRVDTWPYSDKSFLTSWTRRILGEYPRLNIVGEEWTTNPAILAYWQRGALRRDGYESMVPSLMDFPLQYAIVSALREDESWNAGLVRIYRLLANDFQYADAGNLVTFLDNHDMSRVYTQLAEDEALFRMAVGMLLTTRGIPQVYYGTEILMGNPGTDSHGVIRSDFPGGWPNDRVDGFSAEGLADDQVRAQDFFRRLLTWRRDATAVHTGKLTHYAPENGVYVYFRHDAAQRVMVAVNKNRERTTLDTSRFAGLLSGRETGRDIVADRPVAFAGELSLDPMSIAVIELDPPVLAGPGITGTVLRHPNFMSTHVDARHVDVWLPPAYDDDPGRRFPVLYMHDGQNVFDPAQSYGGVDWGIDETMSRLIADGEVRDAIVVAVWNNGERRVAEYMPAKAVDGESLWFAPGRVVDIADEPILSDDYLRFLTGELKPFIDRHYRTLPGRDDTFIMGSSMGGLISAYAVAEYPAVFGGAGCISTHWPAGKGAVLRYLADRLPPAGRHRFYFDFGTETLDALYEPYQAEMDVIMRRAGYSPGADWLTLKYDGADHSERAWRTRMDVPLKHLLGNRR